MNFPSIKTLRTLGIDRETAIQVRDIMRGYQSVPCRGCGRMNDIGTVDPYPYNYCAYFSDGKHRYSKLAAIDRLIGTSGVEYIAPGSNAKSPAFYYCNAGDTYAPTIVKIGGRFRVTTWGDLVERGTYA